MRKMTRLHAIAKHEREADTRSATKQVANMAPQDRSWRMAKDPIRYQLALAILRHSLARERCRIPREYQGPSMHFSGSKSGVCGQGSYVAPPMNRVMRARSCPKEREWRSFGL